MANLSITNTPFVAGTIIVASEVTTNFTDVSSYINARNSGSTDWDFVSSAGLITAKDGVRSSDENAAAPAYSFTSDTDTGMFRTSADILGFSTGGTSRLTIEADGQLLGINGTASVPTYSFSSDTDTGIHRQGADRLDLIAGGATTFFITTTRAVVNTGTLSVPNGTAALPGYTFNNDLDSGIFLGGTNIISFSTSGTKRLDIRSDGQLQGINGAVGAPTYSFTNDTTSGLYRSASATITMAIGGSNVGRWTSNGYDISALSSDIRLPSGAVGSPPLRFNARNTGLFSPSTDVVGMSNDSNENMRWDTNSTAAQTRVQIFDNDNAQLERISVGVADSGGAGFKVLRIPN